MKLRSRRFKKSLAKISPELARRISLPEGAGEIRCCLWLQAADVEFPHYDITLVPQAADILHGNGTMAMSQIDARFRLFGIESFGQRHSPRESALLMAAYGPAVYEIPVNGAEAALVQFAWLNSRPESLPGDLRGPDLHRRGYWINPIRNRRIARLADVLHAGNPGNIKLDPQIDQWWQLHRKPEMHVVVHCACVEQILAIKAHLRGAKISTALTDDALRRLSRQQRNGITSQRADGYGGLILTDRETACRRPNVDVVIWAGGGPGILMGPLSSLQPNRRPVLVIDYRDHHHRQLFRWSEQRLLQYEESGWFPVGCAESLGRVVRFLLQFPTERRPAMSGSLLDWRYDRDQ